MTFSLVIRDLPERGFKVNMLKYKADILDQLDRCFVFCEVKQVMRHRGAESTRKAPWRRLFCIKHNICQLNLR